MSYDYFQNKRNLNTFEFDVTNGFFCITTISSQTQNMETLSFKKYNFINSNEIWKYIRNHHPIQSIHSGILLEVLFTKFQIKCWPTFKLLTIYITNMLF